MDAGLRDMFPHTITIDPYVSEDGFRAPVYGTSYTNQAYVIQQLRRLQNTEGENRWSTCTIELFGAPGVTVRDRLTLPDGTQPLILEVQTLTDPDGGQLTHQTVFT